MELMGEFDLLEPFLIPFGQTHVPVNFIGVPSLVDGKVCAILSDLVKFVGRYLVEISPYFYQVKISSCIFHSILRI